jgi:hypothetical protein
MTTAFGVIPTGFNRKLLSDILTSIQDKHRTTFGEGIDVAVATELGQLDGNIASELAEIWELAEEAYHGFDRDAAADYLLTALASLTGTERRAARATTVVGVCNLNAGSTAPSGSLVYPTGRPDLLFSLDAAATNSGGSPADIAASATCNQTGPIPITAGTTWVIQTPASGWNNFTNAAHDGVTGRNVDTDIQLRQRMFDELAIRGGSTLRAVKADLENTAAHPELAGIRFVEGLENVDDLIDSNGLTPHSIEMLIDDGDSPSVADNDIAQTIFDSKAAGIKTNGSTLASAVDENGTSQPVRFSRFTLKPVYLAYTLVKTADYPADGDTQIKDLILAKGQALTGGDDVIALAFQAIPLAVAGVTDVTAFALGFAPSPTLDANLPVGIRERATFSGAHVTIA